LRLVSRKKDRENIFFSLGEGVGEGRVKWAREGKERERGEGSEIEVGEEERYYVEMESGVGKEG